MKTTANIVSCILFIQSFSIHAQMEQYGFQRELDEVSDTWHTLELPDDIFEKLSPDFSDIRIYGITSEEDTIEAPYLLRLGTEQIDSHEVGFKLINQSLREGYHYFTFQLPTEATVNHMELDFQRDNFDWRLRLEGSQDLKEWFEIIDDYRILSIKNEHTDYSFTKLRFPASKYTYYRIRIADADPPELLDGRLKLHETKKADYKDYSIVSRQVKNLKKTGESVIDIKLERAVPISYLKLKIDNDYDYYRSMRILYLKDSIQTEKGWKHNYQLLSRTTLSSVEEPEFKFRSTTTRQLRVIIDNRDNEPLVISDISAKGYRHQLITRLAESADYYLTYSNPKAVRPMYDIRRFEDKIPTGLKELKLGLEKAIRHEDSTEASPLFENKALLWVLLGIIVVTLGWFSVRMMRKA